jgi:hypothetical protein
VWPVHSTSASFPSSSGGLAVGLQILTSWPSAHLWPGESHSWGLPSLHP